jgi:hypothetical protein
MPSLSSSGSLITVDDTPAEKRVKVRSKLFPSIMATERVTMKKEKIEWDKEHVFGLLRFKNHFDRGVARAFPRLVGIKIYLIF